MARAPGVRTGSRARAGTDTALERGAARSRAVVVAPTRAEAQLREARPGRARGRRFLARRPAPARQTGIAPLAAALNSHSARVLVGPKTQPKG